MAPGSRSPASVDAVQLFTSGTNPGGYTLTSIDLEFYTGIWRPRTPPAVKLHEVTVTRYFRHSGDSGGHADHFIDGIYTVQWK